MYRWMSPGLVAVMSKSGWRLKSYYRRWRHRAESVTRHGFLPCLTDLSLRAPDGNREPAVWKSEAISVVQLKGWTAHAVRKEHSLCQHNNKDFNLPLLRRMNNIWPPRRAAATPSTPPNSDLPVLKHLRQKWLLRKTPTPSTLTPTTSATEFTIDTTSVTSCRSRDQDSHVAQVSSTKKRYQIWSRSRTTRNAVLELAMLAGTILVETSQMTQGIPYVESLAKIIEYVAKATKELQKVETTLSTLSERIVRLQGIIVDVREDSQWQGTLPLGLEEPFRLLEKLLGQVIDVLSRYEGSRLNCLKRFLSRKDTLRDLQKCEVDISNAIEEFNTRLNIQQTLIEHDMKESLTVVENKVDAVKTITEELEVRDQTRHVVVLTALLISGASGGTTLIVSAILFGKARPL
ncbi:uncharacterized protein STEHIDRAFT_138337 [Stereum hirsutum FP-91666 SS1]|uniref:uncharacterized protein n=1 Tax=Stereum hirsutum (strain FP-91666) TaxID=721885 RepID=UPI000440E193|nr:uncharacterized protein STEHIDRAFT_138337 [Stereum hirsutum FP-91666 SS1]EIM89426.1 hypothetical protein STEHIDRAFT_138337 [Stereum hirsutum FP-91666 SS1]